MQSTLNNEQGGFSMLKIGDKIKSLRKAQDITQEKLAAYLNISYQAISKWENGTALPDITLVPKIANFFGVSADELLCMKEIEETEELREYEKVYHENNRLGKMLDNIVISREVLTKYPRNYQWMLNLSYSLIQYNDTEEHNKYSLEHGFVEEAIKICERILEDCTIDSIRHSAIQILCYSYRGVGKEDLALRLANEMPDLYLCRDHLLTHIYRGEKQIEQCQNVLLSMIDSSSGIIGMLVSFVVSFFWGQKINLSLTNPFLPGVFSLQTFVVFPNLLSHSLSAFNKEFFVLRMIHFTSFKRNAVYFKILLQQFNICN